MTLNPIINAKLRKYKEDFYLSCNDDEAFERFINYHVLSKFQPGVFDTDFELMDLISVGGGDDLGLDGIAIFLNGQMIRSCEDIDDLLSGSKRGNFEIVFTQSKNKSKFDLGEFMKFTNGVENFLQDDITMPHNKNIDSWHMIYQYILSDDIIIKWGESPSIKMFYAVNGTLEYAPSIKSYSEEVVKRLSEKKIYDSIDIQLIDDKALMKLIDCNENNFEFVIDIVDSMPLPEVGEVDNSRVVLCKASELIGMMTTSDGFLRRNIFEDNVRDYQGDSTINLEIQNTIRNEAERFVLLNNGITVVCSGITDANRKIRITNPQVVNGCQTCCVLYYSQKQGLSLENIHVVVKFIGTDNDDIVNSIVKGTNRQNIVYEEAFEITSEFHKTLEKYFTAMSVGGMEKIYYERRSKQYEANQLVKPLQKVSFRALIQSTVSVFLNRPEEGHKHESTLLNKYKNALFKDNQSFEPYYVASFLNLYMEKLYRMRMFPVEIYTYKMQIMLIFKELIAGPSPDINKKKDIEKYCKQMLEILADKDKSFEYVQKSIKVFEDVSSSWIKEKGDTYRFAIKDNADFTQYLLCKIRGKSVQEEEIHNTGRVLNVNTNRTGMLFGFIKCVPENIYFSENDNPNISIDYEGKMVTYDRLVDGEKIRAVNVKLVEK